MNLLLKFHLVQAVFGGELSATIFALKGHLSLTKWNIILMLRDFWKQSFLWKHLQKYLIHMLSCYQTTLPLYMASTICTLINLICVIPLYLKYGLGVRIKSFGLLLLAFQERQTMMLMQNHQKANQRWTYFHQVSMPNYQFFSHTISYFIPKGYAYYCCFNIMVG